MITALLFILFLVFIFIRIPVAMAIGLATYICFLIGDYNLVSLPQQMAASTKSIPLMAIPFFILAGNLMNEMGVTKRIFDFSNAVVGSIRGGLAHVNILASMIFAGISGAALADAAGLGSIEIRAMKESGYDKAFSAAVTAASATIGPIIPPSIMMVIYAIMANVSIAEMFLAGVVPGVVIGIFLMLFIYIRVITGRQKCPPPTPWSLQRLAGTIKSGILALLSPVIIVWGMVGGIVTPTEAGILAIAYSLVLGIIFRTLTLKKLIATLRQSVHSTALIMYIIAVSSAMSWLITMEGSPIVIAEALRGITENKYVMLLVVNVFLLVLGCILETLPAMLISVPILLPLVLDFGVDPIHFGVILIFNLLIGIITPPMGIGLYVMTAVSGVRFEAIAMASFPFLIALLISLIIITYLPSICLFLPSLIIN
jgi:tripartite ATP-independent transporter DctM subunit